MKKTTLIIISILAGLLTVLYVNELIKGLAAGLITGGDITFIFKGIILTAAIPVTKGTGFSAYIFLLALPLILSVLYIETSALTLKKNNNLWLRQGLVIFQLVNLGYIIVNIFIGIISVIARGMFSSSWVRLLEYAEFSYTKQLIFMLIILILLLTYINYSTNRMKKYITIVKEK